MSLVVVWLNIVFASFGPYERRNATVVRAISRRVARYRREQHRELWPAYNPDLHLNKNQLRDFCNRHRRLRTRSLSADQNLWDLQALVSVAGANFERKLRCAVSSQDAPHGSDAFPRHAFRTFLFEVHKCRESNRGAGSAISD